MSVKRFCDRCGGEIGDRGFSELSVEDRGDLRDSVRYMEDDDLCEACRRSLDEWFNEGSDAK